MLGIIAAVFVVIVVLGFFLFDYAARKSTEAYIICMLMLAFVIFVSALTMFSSLRVQIMQNKNLDGLLVGIFALIVAMPAFFGGLLCGLMMLFEPRSRSRDRIHTENHASN